MEVCKLGEKAHDKKLNLQRKADIRKDTRAVRNPDLDLSWSIRVALGNRRVERLDNHISVNRCFFLVLCDQLLNT
jgi:hypothetical protein